MVKKYVVVTVVVIAAALLCRVDPTYGQEEDPHFLNEWVAEIEGGLNHARSVAERHGFEVLGQMPFIDNHFIIRHVDVPTRSKRSADHHTTRLTEDSQVKWAEQQFVRARSKRDYAAEDSPPELSRSKHHKMRKEKCTAYQPLQFHDPDYPCQWYMIGDYNHSYMSNVQNVWNMGFTGDGIVVCVVDDGLEYNHTDLYPNYDPYASTDLNGNDFDPMPRYENPESNDHGTRCAGEISMVANNNKCGVGIAYKSKIGGIRLLDGNITDRLEGEALSFNHTHIDIYSLSWGPKDDGMTLDKPRLVAQNAMGMAIEHGRGGKGVIYTLASGNGGAFNDDCNCDGYASSLYTISVSSVSREGRKPIFGERCPSTLTATYSSGSGLGPSVVSTDLHDTCTLYHSGTSASAPMASGFIALVLEANPSLTWRDVQHLVVITSKHEQLMMEEGWNKNAANLCVNPAFGFGLMDPEDMVRRATNWIPVPEQRECKSTPIVSKTLRTNHASREVRGGGKAEVEFDVDFDCCQNERTLINYLEHVQFIFTMNYTTRGAISAYATSPSGTLTCLLRSRTFDNSSSNFEEWPLMSVHTWGENPCGKWTFRVADEGRLGKYNSGTLVDVKMILYGTKTAPFYHGDPSIQCTLPTSSTTQKIQTSFKTGGYRPYGGKHSSQYAWNRDTDER